MSREEIPVEEGLEELLEAMGLLLRTSVEGKEFQQVSVQA